MAAPKKAAKTTKAAKTAPDVSAPGKSAPSATSKPVIVTNRPILQDPMMVDEAKTANKPTAKSDLTHTTAMTVQPLEKPEPEPEPPKEEPPAKPKPILVDETPEEPEPPQEKPAASKPKSSPDAEAEAEKQRAANVEHLIESGQYELPINNVEKRKTKRFVVLGMVLAIFLALAWADIALDAGLIHVNNVQPVTHFFSN